MRSWLLGRVDEQLVEFHPPAPAFYDALDGTLPTPGEQPDILPSDVRVYFYDASGRLLNDSLGSETKPGPRLTDDAQDLGLRDGHPQILPATSGDGRWRVMLNPGPGGMNAVVTLPLDTVDGAASKILWLNAVLLAVTSATRTGCGRFSRTCSPTPASTPQRAPASTSASTRPRRVPEPAARTDPDASPLHRPCRSARRSA